MITFILVAAIVGCIIMAIKEEAAHKRARRNQLPDIEVVSARVHEAWMESKLVQGVTSRKSESGEELMVPYFELSESAKDLDRGTVKAVYKAIQEVA